MLPQSVLAALFGLVGVSLAQSVQVTIQASHGGAGVGLTNTTVTVPIGRRFNDPALDEVSTLYLTGGTDVTLGLVTCTPYSDKSASGTPGPSFTSGQPAVLSADTVVVGALYCVNLINYAEITVTASEGGAQGLSTNTTIYAPLNKVYTNPALQTVSTLYLTGAGDVPLSYITCTPHRNADGTGTSGLPFTSKNPSFLSTNTVVVGSVTCVASTSN